MAKFKRRVFSWAPKSLQTVTVAMDLKDADKRKEYQNDNTF